MLLDKGRCTLCQFVSALRTTGLSVLLNCVLQSYVEELDTIYMCVRVNSLSRCAARRQDGMARRKGE